MIRKMYRQAVVQCKMCGLVSVVPMEQYKVGDKLIPYPGGGKYGRCPRCSTASLYVTKVPGPEAKPATGWKNIPEV